MSSPAHGSAVLGLFAIAMGCASAPSPHVLVTPADTPPAVALPPGEEPVLELRAQGTQNYECRAKQGAPDQHEWVLVAPEADLLDASGRKIGKHYGGPTWESIEDGSKVVGTVKARADAPDPDAIPWLLLAVKETSGEGMFARIATVQRVDTHGGKPPAGGCERTGEVMKVPYRAVYYFARARQQ